MVQRLLDATDNPPAFLKELVTTQAVLVAGTEAVVFVLEQGEEGKPGMRLMHHIRPDESDQATRQAAIQAFVNILQPCVAQSKDGAIEVGSPDGGDAQYCLVTILRDQMQVVAVSAVITRCRSLDRAKQRLSMMQLVAGYFELFSLRRQNEQARSMAERHQHVLQFTGAVANAEGFLSASMALCNELATRTGATRVALGWKKGNQIKIKAMSHTEKFDKKQELTVQIQRAMEEALDQEEPTRFDPEGQSSSNVTREAKKLSGATGGNIVMCSPLRRRDEIVGVLSLEFPAKTKVDEQIEGCIAVATEVLAPQLFDRHENDRLMITKVGLSLRWLAQTAVGAKHWGIKLIIIAAIAGIAATFIPMTYRVRAPFQLVAKDRRSICSPYQGVLEEVYFKPGQAVKKGQVLAQMRTRDMQMKLSQAMAQLATKKAEAEAYYAKDDRQADYNVALAEIEDIQAQIDLLKYQIGQASIVAPFDCIMLRGDLYDRKGAPVEHGDVLFEIAASDPDQPGRIDVEAEIQVNERDIQEVKRVFEQAKAGKIQRDHDGEIASTSDPSEGFKVNLQRIVPAGQPHEGENVFSVYADVKDAAPWLVPGFAGEARVDIEKRTVLWIYTHRLTDWLKLKLWI